LGICADRGIADGSGRQQRIHLARSPEGCMWTREAAPPQAQCPRQSIPDALAHS
jgi:hypothetical protein